MAHINSNLSRAMFFMVFVVGLLLGAESMAQGGEFTQAGPAPAPTMDAGAGFLVTYSAAFVCSSLFFSLIALFFH